MSVRPLSLFAAILLCSLGFSQSGTTVYVSPTGDDEAAGTIESPLRTPQGALVRVRHLRQNGATGQFIVQFGQGTYHLDDTLEIGNADSGAFGVPLVFRGENKDVFFDGSVKVTGWQLATGSAAGRLKPEVRAKVFEALLPLSGGSLLDTGQMNQRGFPYGSPQTWSTLIFNGSQMTLARYPNEGWMRTRTIAGQLSSIQLTDPEPFSWQNDGDVWAYGFFRWDWADSYERIANFDAFSGRIDLESQPYYGISGSQRFVLVNALEAVDAPGEFYIDRNAGKVYFFVPLEGASDAQKIASLNAGASLTSVPTTLVETYDARDVTFENITFQNGRGSGAWARYGARIAFKGCTFRNFDSLALLVASGQDDTVQSCDFYDLSEGAIGLYGGDRSTLKRSGHIVENCYFHDYAKVCKSFRPGVDVWGVGHTISHCRFEDAPHSAVIVHGNNNVVEYSEFSRVCLETNDSGAVYLGRNPTYQGNKVWYNKFSEIWTEQSGAYSNFVTGVYLDDMACGSNVSMNVFENVQIGAVIGGGRDNTLKNNYFFDTDKAVHVDARGTSWASDFMTAWDVPGMLGAVPYKGATWKKAYSKFPNYLKDKPELPKRNTVAYSVNVGNLDWLLLLDGVKLSTKSSSGPLYGPNNSVTLTDPGFADMAGGNYWFPKNSKLAKLKIKEIDPTLIGLYYDEYRTYIEASRPDSGGGATDIGSKGDAEPGTVEAGDSGSKDDSGGDQESNGSTGRNGLATVIRRKH